MTINQKIASSMVCERIKVLAVLATTLLTACHGPDNSRKSDSIKVEREVLLSDITGKSNAVIAMSQGGFAIGGSRGTAWAVGVDRDGRLLWKYDEPRDDRAKTSDQSDFTGVVSLSNGNLLFCGRTETQAGDLGLITILDSSGKLVERRRLVPKQDRKFFASEFLRCLHWNDGIAVLGSTTNGSTGFLWFMKLDATGEQVSERVDPDMVSTSTDSADGGGLMLAGYDVKGAQARLVHVDQRLTVLADRFIKGSGFGLLRSLRPRDDVRLIAYQGAGRALLYALDDRLHDISSPEKFEPLVMDPGCGYLLDDGSLALFGYVQRGGGAFTLPYTAAVQWRDGSGRLKAEHIFSPNYASFSISDALPLGSKRFLVVRDVTAQDPAASGLALSWVSFE
jgi:hypothetical protein